MRPQRIVDQGRRLAIGALFLLVAALAPAPAAFASQGATDQYTEQAPTGPSNNGQQLQTQAPTKSSGGGGGGSSSHTTSSPSPSAAAPAPSSSAPSPTYSPSQSTSSSLTGGDDQAKPKTVKPPKAAAISPPKPVHPDAPANTASGTSSDDGGSTLPLLGYPLTTFLAVVLVLVLLALAAGAAVLSRGRLWGASRSG